MHWGFGWGMGGMMVWWWVLGILLIAGVVWVLAKSGGGPVTGQQDSPETTLKRRYARGELSRDEYERRLTDLRT